MIRLPAVFILLAVFALCVGVLFTVPIQAADTGTVAATVTAQQISVSVSSGTVTYGTLGLSSTQDTTSGGTNETQTATNTGNVAEDFNIKSSDAVGTSNWTISASAIDANQYMHKFSTNSGSSWTAMTTSYSMGMGTNISPSGTQDFDLQILTPSSTTDYDQKTITVTVQAVAH